LALQNLRYEQRHYEQEIAAAQAVHFDEAPLHMARESASGGSDDEQHTRMLARLAGELAERKRLQARVAELKRECDALGKQNATLDAFLGSLKGKLAGLADTSRPLQQFMALPHVTRPDAERTATSLLPTPLYVLFAAGGGFREACDRLLTVRVDGDVGLAAQFLACADKPLAPFPLSVTLVFQLADPTAAAAATAATAPPPPPSLVPIRFAYLPALNIVTVTVTTTDGKPAGIGSQDVLVNLVPDDMGDVSPNPAHHFDGQRRAIKFDATARPYRWAQWLAGLDFVPLARAEQQPDQRSSVATILTLLKQRLVARKSLATQFKSLSE
jgi:THO complex subunit 5